MGYDTIIETHFVTIETLQKALLLTVQSLLWSNFHQKIVDAIDKSTSQANYVEAVSLPPSRFLRTRSK